MVYNIPNRSCLEAVRPADTFACPRSSTNILRHCGRANAHETKVITVAAAYDRPLWSRRALSLTRPAAAWSGLNVSSSHRDAINAGLKGLRGLQGNNSTGALDHDAGLGYPTAVSRAFSTCPSGLLRAGAFTFNERFRRLRRTNGAIDKNRISRLYRKCLLRHRNVTGLLDIKVPPPSVFLKVATGGALSGVRVCRRSTQSA